MKRLFLTGPIGCGKSTLIKNALGGDAGRAGGFVTVRSLSPEDALLGFDLLPASSWADWGVERRALSPDPGRFLTFGEDGPARNDEVFRTLAPALLRCAADAPFAVLDEIGGAELTLPAFSAALYALLRSPLPCVGVLKSPAASDALRRRVGLPEDWARAARELRQFLENDPDTLVLETAGRYDDAAENALLSWKEEWSHEKPEKAL